MKKMFHVPEYFHDLSLKLSDVLDDIRVNETMVMKQRKAILLQETLFTVLYRATDPDVSIYHFGSLSEGTTTPGLQSDSDTLTCSSKKTVIQDFADWQLGSTYLLMVKDENTPPGYCNLQLLRSDLPLPHVHIENEQNVKVSSDRVLLKNTSLKFNYGHGPSNVQLGGPNERDQDFVCALTCKSWPKEASQWFQRGHLNNWPTRDTKNFSENSDCFVVPVGSKVSQNEVLEWRISTSLAERSVMFSLNITQIRCYILMKMILKTYLNSHLSSFMCKTVLLYCIENTQPNLWKEFNLMKCLSYCLQRLYTNLVEGNCPHFIIPGNNLMARKFSVQVKNELQQKLCHIIESNGHALFGIQIDDLGRRLLIKLTTLHPPVQREIISFYLGNFIDLNWCISVIHNHILRMFSNDTPEFIEQKLLQHIKIFTTVYKNGNKFEQAASSLLAPLICSTLGSIKASLSLQTNNNVSSEAFNWLQAGLNSDVSSGRLKLASVLYSMGDIMSTEHILQESERKYDIQAVEPVSHHIPSNWLYRQFVEEVYLKDIVNAIRENTASCVRFSSAEINCIPHELRYEMFRSTRDELIHRDMDHDYWMDWAEADSLPYLFFLQYKTYGQLQRFSDQQKALNKLMVTIATERNLYHKETALNLLGQCLEKEQRIQDALQCYISSLHIRKRNNVARIHICKLLANIANRV